MNEDFNIERFIPLDLSEMLKNFIKNYKIDGLSDSNTFDFYQFILKSYQLPRRNRYSIKMLAKELQENNIKVSLIINIYYHSLNCLALKDGLSIYGEGFLI